MRHLVVGFLEWAEAGNVLDIFQIAFPCSLIFLKYEGVKPVTFLN